MFSCFERLSTLYVKGLIFLVVITLVVLYYFSMQNYARNVYSEPCRYKKHKYLLKRTFNNMSSKHCPDDICMARNGQNELIQVKCLNFLLYSFSSIDNT